MDNFDRNNFEIYKKADSLSYALCPIRGEIVLPEYKPEEKVRLSFIYFVIELSDIYPKVIDVSIEKDRLDISLYNNYLAEILDYVPPVLIVETKREDYDLINAYSQLVEYLKISKVEYGLLFNINQAFKIVKNSSNYECMALSAPYEIHDFILTSIYNQNVQFEEERVLFLRAKEGDFESFRKLAMKYRRNKRILFRANKNDIEYLIEGHLFEFDDKFFKYTKCGYDSKSDNKPFFCNIEFLSLERILRY